MIIIDSNCIGYQALYSLGDLSNGARPTGVLYGFMFEVLKLGKRFNGNKFMFCWDSRNSYRSRIYPEYKQNRKAIPPEEIIARRMAKEQFQLLKTELLHQLGFGCVFFQAGYEADDLIAYLCKSLVNESKIIVTTDKDLYQLLDPITVIYNPRLKNVLTDRWFKTTYGITPDQWVEAKAISGCESDSVKGVKGVADPAHSVNSKALSYLRNELKTGTIFKRIVESKGVIERNRTLIKLPFDGLKPISLELSEDDFSKDAIIEVFDRYRFQSLLDQMDDWMQYVCLMK